MRIAMNTAIVTVFMAFGAARRLGVLACRRGADRLAFAAPIAAWRSR